MGEMVLTSARILPPPQGQTYAILLVVFRSNEVKLEGQEIGHVVGIYLICAWELWHFYFLTWTLVK